MEFCGLNCTLERLCRESAGLSEELVRSFTLELLKAVEVLHDNNIVHRDIKPQNIFLKEATDGSGYLLKLGDFGCSFKSSSASTGVKATGIVGTTCKTNINKTI
jgi:mitogen-activated protein kinase kinase kinase 4